MGQSRFQWLGQILSGLTVFASLVFVGYELKRNNDLAVVQSQHELVATSIELKTLLTDPRTLSTLMSEEIDEFSREDELLFVALVGAWFDLYELVILSQQKGIINDEQFVVWMNGMCTLPKHWLMAFHTKIGDRGTYLEGVGENVLRCLRDDLLL